LPQIEHPSKCHEQTIAPHPGVAALSGRLQLEELISARIPIEQVNQGFEALRRGRAAIRSVVVF
jgi:Zn-dependent alcohol dehydrogenase